MDKKIAEKLWDKWLLESVIFYNYQESNVQNQSIRDNLIDEFSVLDKETKLLRQGIINRLTMKQYNQMNPDFSNIEKVTSSKMIIDWYYRYINALERKRIISRRLDMYLIDGEAA